MNTNNQPTGIDIDDLELDNSLGDTVTKVSFDGTFIERPKNAVDPNTAESIDDFINNNSNNVKTAERQATTEQKFVRDADGNSVPVSDLDTYDLEVTTDNELISLRNQIKENLGDVITYEDGTEIPVDNLSKEDLVNVIESLTSDSDENSNGTSLDENAELILQAYQEGGVEALIELLKSNNLLDENNIANTQSDIITQIKSMSEDELLYFDAQNKCTDCTAEELEATVDSMKNSKGYKKIVSGIRQSLIQEEQQRIQLEQKQAEIEHAQALEEIRSEVMTQVKNIPEIFGIENNQEIIQELTPMLLTPSKEDPEYSEFVNYLLSDPTAQYKAAFFLHYEKEIQDFINNQIKEAEEKGKRSVFSKLPSKPKTSINTEKRGTKISTEGVNLTGKPSTKAYSIDDDF